MCNSSKTNKNGLYLNIFYWLTFKTAEIFLCLSKVNFLVASSSCFRCSLSNLLVTNAKAWFKFELFELYDPVFVKLLLQIEDVEAIELTLDLVEVLAKLFLAALGSPALEVDSIEHVESANDELDISNDWLDCESDENLSIWNKN